MKIELKGSGPILCFGGSYSNLQATIAMKCVAERYSVPPGRVICTGDVVAYCANPNETAELIRDWGCHVIKGNCEEQLAHRAADCGCGFGDGTACDLLAQGWYSFADASLSDDLRQWMAGLPEQLTFDVSGRTAHVIHGGVSEIARFIFESTSSKEKEEEMRAAGADIIIAGHCGIPFVEKIGRRVWFNPGVIGMPANDGTRDGWFGLIKPDTSSGALNFALKRLTYDSTSAAEAMIRSHHADAYAAGLKEGLWPSLDVLPATERASTGKPLSELETNA